MRILFILICLIVVENSFADSPRLRFSFKSANGLYELRPSDTIFSDNKIYTDSIYNSKTKKYEIYQYSFSDKYYWGLYDLRTNKKLYTIKNDSIAIEFQTVEVSDTGQNIIIINDYSGPYPFPEFEVLHFYKTDKLVKTISLGELVENMCSISFSVSHMRWSFGFGFTQKNDFKIKTYEYFNFEYDLNGELINKTSDERIKPKDDIVTAKIKRIENGKYIFNIRKSIRNKLQPDEDLIIEVSDKTMRKIHGKFYGLLPARNKIMKSEFISTFLFRNNQPVISEIRFPTYNSSTDCNFVNEYKNK